MLVSLSIFPHSPGKTPSTEARYSLEDEQNPLRNISGLSRYARNIIR